MHAITIGIQLVITVRCGDHCMHTIIIGTASDNYEMWGSMHARNYNRYS